MHAYPEPVKAANVAIVGPFHAHDNGWQWRLLLTDEVWPTDLEPDRDVLGNLLGVQLYCKSNKCTTRTLQHLRHAPPLVGVIMGVQYEHDRYIRLITIGGKGRTSISRRQIVLPVQVSHAGPHQAVPKVERDVDDLPWEIECHRCKSSGRITSITVPHEP